MAFQLSLINPNSDSVLTEYLREIAVAVLPPGSAVESMTNADAPPVLETAAESAAAASAVVAMAEGAACADALFVACFGNPGVAPLRERSAKAVVGLGEAALVGAGFTSRRFGLLTTLECGIGGLWDQLEAAGRREACAGIRAVNEGVKASREDPEGNGLLGRLEHEGAQLVEAGADGIVLACATFSPHAPRLAARLGVPVNDGARLGPALAYGLWAAARPVGVANAADDGAGETDARANA